MPAIFAFAEDLNSHRRSILVSLQQGGMLMNLNYRSQLILTVFPVLVGNVLCTLLHHCIYRNIAFFICGMLWIFQPVMAGTQEPTKKQLNQIRFWAAEF